MLCIVKLTGCSLQVASNVPSVDKRSALNETITESF